MSQGLINRLKHWVAGEFEDDVYQLEDEFDFRHHQQAVRQETEVMDVKPRRSPKVIEHPNSNKSQVVVIEPRMFEESLEIIEHLRSRKSVILNLHMLDTAQSQRVVDFLSGATHALDGHQQRIGDGVFIFTPNNVAIRSEAEEAPVAQQDVEDAFWKQAY